MPDRQVRPQAGSGTRRVLILASPGDASEIAARHYARTLSRHGPTPLGVDWKNLPSQYLRFVQLAKLCDFTGPFSLNDFGCGYGALLDYLDVRQPGAQLRYRGIDIVPEMVGAAAAHHAGDPRATFAVDSRCGAIADYSVASGVFNVRLGFDVGDWEAYVERILGDLRDSSRIGLAVNFMLPLDTGAMEDGLYRTPPRRWVDFCTRRLSCSVEIVEAYGLREFTLLAHLPA